MGKKRSNAQRIGIGGENAFRFFAQEHRLLPSKFEEDMGTDFLCQMEGTRDAQGTASITGAIIGACVRSTTNAVGRIRLTRDDAEHLLESSFPTAVFLFKASAPQGMFYRFLDAEFMEILRFFIAGDAKSLSLVPKQMKHAEAFDQDLNLAVVSGFVEQSRIEVAGRGIAKHVANAQLSVHRDASGALSIVRSPNFLDYFEHAEEPSKDAVFVAAFGAPRLFQERVAALPFKQPFLESLTALPGLYVLEGAVRRESVVLHVKGVPGTAECAFERVVTGDHHGYVHESGFSLTVSARKKQGDRWVHEHDASIDPFVPLDLSKHEPLLRFLSYCDESASIEVAGETHQYKAVFFKELANVSWFAESLIQAREFPGWKSQLAVLSKMPSEEQLYTLAVLAKLRQEPSIFHGLKFGYQGLPLEQAEETAIALRVPVVGNVGDAAIVAWLATAVTIFTTSSDTFVGLRLDRVDGVTLSIRNYISNKSANPEIVIAAGWPSFRIMQSSIETGSVVPETWSLSAEPITVKDNAEEP